MKNLFYAAIVLTALTSCTKSQFVALNSDAPITDYSTFFFENDTMKVSYHFKGHDCPVNIEVYNKLSVPLYIQWTKSAVVVNGRTVPFHKNESRFTSRTSTTEIDWGGISTSHSDTGGIIQQPEGVSFIAPHSSVAGNNRLYLKSKFFNVATNPRAKKSKKMVGTVSLKRYEFKKEDSPFRFDSYLTVSTEQDGSNATYILNSFWVSEVSQSASIGDGYPLKDNEFRLTEATGFGVFVGGTVLIGGAVLLTLADDE